MSNSRIIFLVTALLIVAGAVVPAVVRDDRHFLPHAVAARSDDARSLDGAAEEMEDDRAAEDAARPKRKNGGFGRAITSPFRALAKLFGGGRKRSPEAAKKEEVKAPAVAESKPARKPAREEKREKKSVAAAPPPAAAAPPPVAAVRAAPDSPPPAEGARVVRPAEARPSPAAGLWVPVIEGIPKDPLTQGRALLQHGYLNEAVSELTVAASIGPNLVEANNLLGLAYDRLGRHRAAIAAYERALSVAPKDPVVLANLGNSLYFDSNFDAALKRLKQAAQLSPHNMVVHNNLGVVQAQAGKYDDAFKSFARAGSDYDAHVKLARILESARRDKDAARHYEAALRLQPGTTALLERLVRIYERTGKQDKADTARRALGQPKNEQKTLTGGG